jgi:hypothetical protein
MSDLLQSTVNLKIQNLKNSADLIKMQEQLLEREQVIFSKEEACKAARDEQINLENFRYMLDQKIKTLNMDKEKLLQDVGEKEVCLLFIYSI